MIQHHSPNFEFPVFEAEEDDVEEIPDEITRLLEHEEKIIQPHLENLETVNLGSEDCVREVKIGALLEESVKKGLIELLREYVDVFAWSYEDMPGLDTDIMQHFLPLKPECVPMKQKLRRTHPDMAVKIKEEVQKQIDAGFLVTSTYPQWMANIVPLRICRSHQKPRINLLLNFLFDLYCHIRMSSSELLLHRHALRLQR